MIKQLFKKIGIDGAIAYTVLSRLIQAGGGMVTILFIAKYLTKVEQGYYFTFTSLLAIQIFFELGLSGIITQFVAHEAAELKITEDGKFEGSDKFKSRLSSLLHFCINWYLIVAILVFAILLVAGYLFFNRYGENNEKVEWIIPWILISISTSCALISSPILAFLEGLGKVKDVAKMRFVQQVCQLSLLFLLLPIGFKLFASPIASLISVFIIPLQLFFSKKKDFFLYVWKSLSSFTVNYRKEIFPYQWRISLSWISGYFMYQLFNPVIFAVDGSVAAGQMGISLAALSGVLTVSLSWINTKIPVFSSLIAKKDYQSLDKLFNKTVKQSNIICALSLLFLCGVIMVLQHIGNPFGNRFLPIKWFSLLALSTFANQYISALATYLRCHKREPLLVFSAIMALLTAASTLILGKIFGLSGIVISYTFLTLIVSMIWIIIIFRKKRIEWHQDGLVATES